PTPLRNHQMIQDHLAGCGPHYLRTDEALQKMFADVQNDAKKVREIEADAWEDFLDMTMSQALLWASENIDPAKTPSEVVLTEPYLMGSHASGTGAWVSGPEDIAPKQSLLRLQKIKDEYVAGQDSGYLTNGPTLRRGLELLHMLREDLPRMAARDRHELLRAWEVWDRYYCAEAHARHVLFREET